LRRYQRDWIAARRAAALAGKSCAWCGSTERLEFDHVDPSLKVDHKVWSWSPARRAAELEKCRILCHSCHHERTRQQFSKALVHGTLNAYKKKGCRCAECRLANTQRVRAQRAGASAQAVGGAR
jgi:hypothetical protein